MATGNTALPPDESKGPVLLALTCVLCAFTIITSGLRLWVRFVTGHLGRDDYTIAVVALLAVARTAVQIVSVQHGNGSHKAYLSAEDYIFVNELTWFTQVLLFVTICLLKTSIALLLLRLKDTRPIKITMYTMIAGLILTNLLPVIVLLAECNPLSQYWNPQPGGVCWTSKVRIYSIYVQAGYSVLTDLLCSLLPILVVWRVQIPFRKKVAVCGLMSLGLIATACAIVRASSLGTATTDLSYDYAIAAVWANTELHLGIIAANCAISHAIFLYFFTNRAHFFSSREASSRGPSHGPSRSRYAHGYGERSRNVYIRSRNIHSTTITTAGRASVDIPMEDDLALNGGIQKTTEVHVVGRSDSSVGSKEHPDDDDHRHGSRDAVWPLPAQHV